MVNKNRFDKLLQRYSNIARNQSYFTTVTCRELSLEERDGRIIKTSDGRSLVDFINCSYLGLEIHPSVLQGAIELSTKWGVYFSASRLRARIDALDELDSNLSEIFCSYSPVTFSNLTSCHIGVLPLIGSGIVPKIKFRGSPCFIIDKSAHSTLQLCRDTLANFGSVERISFDLSELIESRCKKIAESGSTPFLICDGVGSMGGITSIRTLLTIIDKHEGYLYVDDAHGISSIGKKGAGYVLDALSYIRHPRVIIAGSLSKGFGAFGGFVGFPFEESAQFVKQNCITYTFSGPLPIPSVGAALASSKLHIDNSIEVLQIKLNENIKYFDSLFPLQINPNYGSPSPIRLLITRRLREIQSQSVRTLFDGHFIELPPCVA